MAILIISTYYYYIEEKTWASPPRFQPNPDLRLMDQVREVLRYYNYALKTEQAYCQWVLRYIRFYGGNTHPAELRAGDVERFLSHLVSNRKVSAATQKQALNALVFLYHKVLDVRVDEKIAFWIGFTADGVFAAADSKC